MVILDFQDFQDFQDVQDQADQAVSLAILATQERVVIQATRVEAAHQVIQESVVWV